MRLKAQIMDEAALSRALMRISHEIAEKNKGVENVQLVGIRRRGEPLARQIRSNIIKIEGLEVPCGSVDVRYYRDDLQRLSQEPIVTKAQLDFPVADKTVGLVDDVLYHKDMECTVAKNKVLWTIIPLKIIFDYVKSESVKAEAKALIKAGKVCHSYYYEGDRSLKRWVHYKKNQFHYFEKYKRYFGNKGLRD